MTALPEVAVIAVLLVACYYIHDKELCSLYCVAIIVSPPALLLVVVNFDNILKVLPAFLSHIFNNFANTPGILFVRNTQHNLHASMCKKDNLLEICLICKKQSSVCLFMRSGVQLPFVI